MKLKHKNIFHLPLDNLASPASHSPNLEHSSLSERLAAACMAPSTPPPPINEEFAALTMASISSIVMSPFQREILSLSNGLMSALTGS